MNLPLSDGVIRFLKGILSVIVFSVVSYLANSANLTGVLNVSIATIVSGLALVLEGYLKDKGNGALFGLATQH
jgi:hypothetical protein